VIEHRHGFVDILGPLHAETLGLQEVAHQTDDGRVVVHNEHRSLIPHRLSLPSRIAMCG